jgi:membrane protease YdiL (CAAX protease family)
VATASLIWLLKEWRIPAADVGFTARFSAFDFVVGVTGAVVGLGMWPLAERLAMLGARANVLLRVPADSRRPARGAPLQMSAAAARDAWVVACVGGAVVPSLEEFLFRGYALAALQQHTESALAAMLLVSAAFASVHIVFGARVVVYGFIVSLALSVVVLWRASLYPAMLMHGLINLTAFVVIPLTARRDARGGHTDI